MSTPPTITRRVDHVPVFQGDDAERIEAARREFNRISLDIPLDTPAGAPLRIGDMPETPLEDLRRAAAKAVDDLVAECMPRAVMVTVQALGRRVYRKVVTANPPREDDEADEEAGFNRLTMMDAVLEYFELDDAGSVETTIVAPTFTSREQLVSWLDDLNDGDFENLALRAIRVNEGVSPDPKDSLVSRLDRVSSVISRSRGTTGSR